MATQKQTGIPQKTRLPLMGAYSNRDTGGSKDQRFINMFPETRKVDQLENTKIFINKRPGLTVYKDFGNGEGRALTYFRNRFYLVIGDKLIEDGATPTEVVTLTAATGHVGMILCNSSSLGDYLFVCDGTSAWIVESDGSCTQITDANFPTPHITVPTFIDGYVCLARGSDIYSCTLDDPYTWPTENFISAEMFPDPIISLARQNNQIVAFGSTSTEFFYDAANAAGSPLSRNEAAAIQMGTAAAFAIYQNEQFCIYVSASDSGGRAVWLLKGTQPQKVTDEYIERIIDAEVDMSDCRGFGIRTKGHLFYVLNLKTSGRTLVYDVDEKLWHEWSSNSAGSHTVFSCDTMADSGIGAAHVLHASNGTLYKVDPTVNLDGTDAILCSITTNKYDMDSYNRKFMSSLKLVGDSYSPSNIVTFYWTDDDYQTWSNAKTVNLNDGYPAFQRLGAFRRRAFKFEHALDMPLRLESVEVVYTEGAN